MEITTGAPAVTADAYRAQFDNGVLDRMAGSAIQTRAQYAEANPGISAEDFDDFYRLYRNGYTAK